MSHPAFTCLRQVTIESLKLTFFDYQHKVTGARHLHLAADDTNNAFLVAFLTVPQDSTGVAHILEHTVLCGSQRYPVRDPFFMMTRRSLNTFMNAFTSSDWTAYPFATQNRKDFNNLLQVYLDAVFFPNLNALDFAQEGHRLEFDVPTDANSPLVYKGVVYNEMKGSMSSPVQTLWHTVFEHIFPTITYHYNSGGWPKDIPQLTHEQLRTFHATHYHPSNAIFMTYGNFPVEEHQQLFENGALKQFQALTMNLQVPDERRYEQPQNITASYALESTESLENKTHIVIAWLLGKSNDLRENISSHLLTGVLLDNSASPLRYALETCPVASAPSPLCGYEDHTREACFICGVEGSNPEHADEVEKLIFQVLEEVAEKGVPQEFVDSMLHQIELQQREITGDGFPYGLNLLLNTLPALLHDGDPVATLDIDPILKSLREDCQNREFIPKLVKRLLLDNPHRVRVIMAPDAQLAEQQLAEEKVRLAALQASMDESAKQQIIEQTLALQKRQQTKDDPELLPKVTLSDVPEELVIPEGVEKPLIKKTALPTTWFARGTNGMVYQALVLELPELERELLDVLPLFTECLTEVGYGKKDYRQAAAWQVAISGGIHARLSLRGDVANVNAIKALFSLSGKALVRNHHHLGQLLKDTLETARFDELPHLHELITQTRMDQENSVTERGHHLVMTASSSRISPTGALSHYWYGLEGIRNIKKLDSILEESANLDKLASLFCRIRDRLLQSEPRLLVISEAQFHDDIAARLSACWQHRQLPEQEIKLFSTMGQWLDIPRSDRTMSVVRQAWSTGTQVNFCAKSYPTVAMDHPDAAPLTILGEFLRNGYLHQAIREKGGAYGGGASYDSDTSAFRFYSYRDPRLTETLIDFDKALDWLQNNTHEARTLEEAILGVISRIDRPGSPAGEAMTSFFGSLHGRTPTRRKLFRQRILQVSLEDLQRVGSIYFSPEKAHIAVLSDAKTLDNLATELGLERQVL